MREHREMGEIWDRAEINPQLSAREAAGLQAALRQKRLSNRAVLTFK